MNQPVLFNRSYRGMGLLFAVAGCAAAFHVITATQRDPADTGQVTLYTSAPPECDEIAIVEASSRSAFVFGDQARMDIVIRRLKEEAAAVGANSVLLQDTRSQGGGGAAGTGVGVSSGGGGYISSGIVASSSVKTGRGLAIHVPTESAP